TGVGLLASRNPMPWLWGRVAGDAIDMAAVARTAGPRHPGRSGGVLAALLGVGILDLYAAIKATSKRLSPRQYEESGKNYSHRSGFPRNPQAMRGAAASRRHEMATGQKAAE